MKEPHIIISSFKRTYKILPLIFKRKSIIVLLLLLIGSFFDIAGLASLLPLFTILLKDNIIQEYAVLNSIYLFFGFTTEKQLIILIVFFVFFIITLKNFLILLINKQQAKFTFNIMKFSLLQLHKIYYSKGFEYFKKTNSNYIVRDVYTNSIRFATSVVLGFINLLNEIIILLIIIISIIFYDYKIILLIALTVVPVFVIFFKLTKNKIKQIGDETNKLSPAISKEMFHSIFGYTDVIITGTKKYFINRIKKNIDPLVKINVYRTIFNLVPTKLIESTMVLTITFIIVYGLYFFESKAELLELMGIYAVAAYRIMPSINRMMISINGITESQFVFDSVSLISTNKEEYIETSKGDINFNNNIVLENISFKYTDGNETIFENYNLTIKKGKVVGIKGKSGGGKTTLMNILLGLLKPMSGKILIDGQELNDENIGLWQRKIGYVQQDVFLLDASLAENIAFGIDKDKIDYAKLDIVISAASLTEFVNNLTNGINTSVGERGAQLSGGQRQRVGIARALYFDSEVLFFDEATSALDPQTEKDINESIIKLSEKGLTMIIIAHRDTSLEFVDKLIYV